MLAPAAAPRPPPEPRLSQPTHAGCQVPAREAGVWPCKMEPACGSDSEGVLYGWGKNAPAVEMPPGAGFSVGPGTGIRALVLQARV